MSNDKKDFSVKKKYCPVMQHNVAVKVHHNEQNREECLDCADCIKCENEYLNK